MSDDLVKRLKIMARDIEMWEKLAWGSDSALMREAAARIQELEAKLRKSALQELSALGQASEAYQAQLAAEAKLERAVEALAKIKQTYRGDAHRLIHGDRQIIEIADAILAELKGQGDE